MIRIVKETLCSYSNVLFKKLSNHEMSKMKRFCIHAKLISKEDKSCLISLEKSIFLSDYGDTTLM